MKAIRKANRGSAILEFTLSSIPLIFVMVSVVQMSLGMWNYHTLNEAVNLAARAAAVRGVDCASTCAVTVGQITTMIDNKGVGLVPGSLNVSLTDANGSIVCHPITSCTSSTTVFPRSGGNAVGQVIAVSGSYPFNNAISMFVPGTGYSSFGAPTLTAISQQVIVY